MKELVQEIQVQKVIAKDDLAKIIGAKNKVQTLVTDAEKAGYLLQKATLEARLADAEYKNVVGHIYIKYGLTLEDEINDETGLVTKLVTKEEVK